MTEMVMRLLGYRNPLEGYASKSEGLVDLIYMSGWVL